MSCLEMPRSPVPDFLGEPRRASNDAGTWDHLVPPGVPADARNGGRVQMQDVQPEGADRLDCTIHTLNMRSPDDVGASARRGDHARRDGRGHA